MSIEKKIPQIDLESISRSKNPKLIKLLPNFLLNWCKRIIHQTEVNAFLRKHYLDFGLDFVNAVKAEFTIKGHSIGIENVPQSGGIVLASNHPLGGLDAIVLMSEVGKVRKDQQFLVNDILMNLENLNTLFVPINKHGKNAVEMIHRISETYSSEACTLVFPAGLVSRYQNGTIKDLKWHKSFITQSVKYKRSIVPVYISAQNSNFFYKLASWRKKLGIKANIEMFFLVNEMYKKRNATITIIFGEAIPYTTFTKDHSDNYWAEWMKAKVYELGKKHNLN